MKKTIFLSYSWKDSELANSIDKDIQAEGFEVKRDIRDIKPWKSIKEFMESIRDQDYAILIISSNYLKSRNCMLEVMEAFKDQRYWEKIFSIVTNDANIYTPDGMIAYITYWQDETEKLEGAVNKLKRENSSGLDLVLRQYKSITSTIGPFLEFISDRKNPQISETIDSILTVIPKKPEAVCNDQDHLDNKIKLMAVSPTAKNNDNSISLKKKIALSYAWKDSKLASSIGKALQESGFEVFLGIRVLNQWNSISNVMTSYMSYIENQDFLLLPIISSYYLKSPFCMYELIRAFEFDQHKERIFPFVTKDARIYKLTDRMKWANRWKKKYISAKNQIWGTNPEITIGELQDLEFIAKNTIGVLAKIACCKNPSISKDKKSITQAVELILQVINSPE